MAQSTRSDTLVVNELLAFVQNKLDVMDELSLQQICLSSYKEADILAAKKVLADTAKTSCRLGTRQKDGSGKKDLQDIFRVFKETDPDEISVTYVARDLHLLPPVDFSSIDVTCLLKDIMRLKSDVTDLKKQLEKSNTVVSSLQTEIIALRNNAVQAKLPSPASMQNVTVRHANRQNARLSSPADSNITGSPRGIDRNLQPTSIIETPTQVMISSDLPPTSGKQKKSYAQVAHQCTLPLTKNESAGRPASHIDNEGFTLVKKKPRVRPTRNNRGTATPTAEKTVLHAVEPTIAIYLSRLDPTTSGNEVLQYIKERCERRRVPFEVALQRLDSSRVKTFKSYVLRVPAKNKDAFLVPDFWPEGIVYRRYREARPKMNPKTV